ncbi:MAG: molybdenum cofactor biosynthesis protein MoaE [Candidatus Lokiarchaeota archaeon]
MNSENIPNIKSGIYNKGDVSLEELISSVKNGANISKAGAILVFNGIVRESSNTGNAIETLTIDAYDELANRTMERICNDLKQKKGIIDLRIIHLKGKFQISEDLVYVIVASAHREEGFKTLREAVERYKKEIEVWKQEEFLNGNSKWIH